MNKRVLAVAGAAVLALLAVLAMVIYAKGADDRALRGTETVTVLRVTSQVAAKTPAADLSGSVETVKLPKAAVVDGALTDLSQVSNQVTSTELVPGDQLTRLKFAQPGKVKGDLAVPRGMQTLSIPLPAQRAVAASLKAGDKVGVMISYGSGTGGVTNNAMNGLLVVKVGASVTEAEGQAGGDVMLTVATTTLKAEKIVHGMEFGKVWLTLQDDDTDTGGGKTIGQKDVTP